MATKLNIFILICICGIISAGCISNEVQSPIEEENLSDHEQIVNNNGSIAESLEEENNSANTQPETLEVVSDDEPEKKFMSMVETNNKLKVAAFNVQVFGVSKAAKQDTMEILAKIIRSYDIIAIQEIRDKSQTALPDLVELVNSDGSTYEYVVSERLGRTSSKEQYAYIYDSNTVQINGEAHTYPEPTDTDPFHRQPYIVSISAKEGNYDATLMVIHTDPDEATEEINSLDDVLDYSVNLYPNEQDFIIMGDLNADGNYFKEDSTSDLDEYQWIIDDSLDTTTKSTNYTYDRIILTDTSDYADSSGVFRFDIEYGLTEEETIAVSDHYPVYVELYSEMDMD